MSIQTTVMAVIALQDKPHTEADIRATTGLSRDGVRRLVKSLRELDRIEFAGWGPRNERGGAIPALYTWKDKR